MNISSDAKERFYRSVELIGDDTCFYWKRGDRFQYRNKQYTPQQFSWMISFGDVPKNHVIKTFCGSENCVNAEHLHAIPISDVYKSKLPVEDRFLSHVNKTPYCWEWNVSSGEGYGFFFLNGKKLKAHRFSYQMYKGEIPEGLFVCHTCDNPRCVNPDHLFLGTNSDNQKDCSNKGRKNSQVGEDRYNSKLTPNDILYIRNLRSEGWTLQSIADLYNIRFQYVSKIVNRKVWKHI